MRPRLAITLGDPAGIGPELAIRCARDPRVQAAADVVLVGDAATFAEIDRTNLAVDEVAVLKAPATVGRATAEGGRASYEAILRAIALAKAGAVHGVVTAPINKHALHLAGVDFPGHTEIFAHETASPRVAMMMYAERLAVGLATCHQSLASVPQSLGANRIVEVGELLHAAVAQIRGAAPRMAVLGLNPHAGEEGLFGDEEIRCVAPAVAELRRRGIDAEGPIPPDAGFTRRALARYGAHLCLYHDQGLIPFKMLCFDEGVNVTLGLPFVRTSPDHGTAYDIAGKGIADPSSMVEAALLAARLARFRLDSAPPA